MLRSVSVLLSLPSSSLIPGLKTWKSFSNMNFHNEKWKHLRARALCLLTSRTVCPRRAITRWTSHAQPVALTRVKERIMLHRYRKHAAPTLCHHKLWKRDGGRRAVLLVRAKWRQTHSRHLWRLVLLLADVLGHGVVWVVDRRRVVLWLLVREGC